MYQQTDQIQIGWKALNTILNKMLRTIFRNKPIAGAGISVSEAASGTIISVVNSGDDTSGTGNSGSGGGAGGTGGTGQTSGEGWQQMIVINPTDCSQRYIWYWGTMPNADPSAPAPITQPFSQ